MTEDKKYTYDLAISFAEEDRLIASNIAHALEIRGLNAYYYPDNRPDDIGQNLEQRLEKVFSEEARFAVVIFSENYFRPEKVYTKIELNAIKRRMDVEAGIVYMLPVKLDRALILEDQELNKLIYLEWNHNEKEIADIAYKLLGRELSDAEENLSPGDIIYNSGPAPMIIKGSNVRDINQTVINYQLATPVIVPTFSNPTDTRFTCIKCYHQLDGSTYGKIKCPNCGKINIVTNPDFKALPDHPTLLDDRERKIYGKIRAHIQNKVKDEDYEAAYNYCLEAEQLAPGEYCTWEDFAKVEFLREIYRKPASERLSSFDIIKKIKTHTDKCKDLGIDSEAYDNLVIEIANELFQIEMKRLSTLFGQNSENLDKWPRRNLQALLGYLKSFENCYTLYPDPLFLQEYVEVLAKPYRWMVKKADTGEIKKTCNIGDFNPVAKMKALVAKIKETNLLYKEPEIPTERLEIRKTEILKINGFSIKTQ